MVLGLEAIPGLPKEAGKVGDHSGTTDRPERLSRRRVVDRPNVNRAAEDRRISHESSGRHRDPPPVSVRDRIEQNSLVLRRDDGLHTAKVADISGKRYVSAAKNPGATVGPLWMIYDVTGF